MFKINKILLLLFLLLPSLASADFFYTQAPKTSKKIALTFDDGPGPNTEKFLDLLDKYHIKATFFMNGDQVAMRPKIAQEVLRRGHQIGDHTYSHMNFYAYQKKWGAEKTQEKISSEIELSLAEIKKATGQTPKYIRMPHGFQRDWLKTLAQKFNLKFINWTFGQDWFLKMPDEEMKKNYIKAVHGGGILLFHDGGKNRDKTLAILPAIIAEAQSKNLEFVTVEEIITNP